MRDLFILLQNKKKEKIRRREEALVLNTTARITMTLSANLLDSIAQNMKSSIA